MHLKTKVMVCFLVMLVLFTSSEAFFLKWGSDSANSPSSQKTWVHPLSPSVPPAIRYQYMYPPYESHKMYQLQAPQYSQPEVVPVHQNTGPIPISIPAGASLTPVSLQHVQLVPCMCPVAPEEAEKLQEQSGPGPYLAQAYSQPTYSVPQPVAVASDSSKPTNK